MTLQEAFDATGCATPAELAKLLGISRQAVSSVWDHDAIPKLRVFEIEAIVKGRAEAV